MTADNTPVAGRFAPTPSGFLHLGNIFCSLLAWLYAKSSGGKIVLRIEDLDPQRCSLAKADALARELEWLGLTWDEGAYCSADSDSFSKAAAAISTLTASTFYSSRGLSIRAFAAATSCTPPKRRTPATDILFTPAPAAS